MRRSNFEMQRNAEIGLFTELSNLTASGPSTPDEARGCGFSLDTRVASFL